MSFVQEELSSKNRPGLQSRFCVWDNHLPRVGEMQNKGVQWAKQEVIINFFILKFNIHGLGFGWKKKRREKKKKTPDCFYYSVQSLTAQRALSLRAAPLLYCSLARASFLETLRSWRSAGSQSYDEPSALSQEKRAFLSLENKVKRLQHFSFNPSQCICG